MDSSIPIDAVIAAGDSAPLGSSRLLSAPPGCPSLLSALLGPVRNSSALVGTVRLLSVETESPMSPSSFSGTFSTFPPETSS
ncbi:hypothetical protein NQZ68_035648 [Dissostichus eleginoides]|nr:hypothetical protein NQZ68_035648 [Dissostichus eleginoides]